MNKIERSISLDVTTSFFFLNEIAEYYLQICEKYLAFLFYNSTHFFQKKNPICRREALVNLIC